MFLERANIGVLRMVVRYNQIRKMLITIQDHNHVYLLLHVRAVSHDLDIVQYSIWGDMVC